MKTINTKNSELASMRQSFGDTLLDLGSELPNLYVVSADLKESLRLGKFASRFRNRFVEAGVAENNAVAVAAGLCKTGKTVFFATFACFSPGLTFATIRQSVCYNHLPVKLVGGYSGLMAGVLGATHQMLEDVALARSLPNLEVFAPIDAVETEKIIRTVTCSPRPAYIRLVAPDTPVIFPKKLSFTIGKSHILQKGGDVTVLGYGPVLTQAFGIDQASLEIINCSSIKPLDSETIIHSVAKTGRLIVVEDHQKNGGLGEAVASMILHYRLRCKFIHLAVDNQFGQSAKNYPELFDHYGIGRTAIINAINKLK